MKILVLIISLTAFAYVTNAQTKGRPISLSGTTWSLLYTTGRQNSRDYSEYAKITFKQGNSCVVDNGDRCTFSVKGANLTIHVNDTSTAYVKSVEAKLAGNSARGQATLGMKEVPFWIRMRKIS